MIEFELIDDSQTIDVNLIDDTEAIQVDIIKEIDKYSDLKELPSINDVTLIGNKPLHELGIQPEGDYATNTELNSGLATKVDKVTGKGLSTNDYTNEEKQKLSTLENYDDTEVRELIDTKQPRGNYLTEETDPTVPNYVKSITQSNITSWNNKADKSEIPDVSNFATKTELNNETTNRENTDLGLQEQIDAITSSSDVKDIVGTYTELQNYDTSTLGNDDIIKVLQDSTHNEAMTYYRWVISGGTGSWQYVGQEGPYYTKSETETLLNDKQDEITSSNKLLSDLVSDTNQTNKFVTSTDITTWNGKYSKPSTGIPKTDLASDVQTSLGKADTAIQDTELQSLCIDTNSPTPNFDNMTPIATYEYDISDKSYHPVYTLPNTGLSYSDTNIVVAYRITATGTNIYSSSDIIDVWHNPCSYPLTTVMHRTLSTSASTTGIQYLRAVYPTSTYLNNSNYPLGQEIVAYNTTIRHIKIEVFKTPLNIIWKTSADSSIYIDSTHNANNSIMLYNVRGWIYRQPQSFVASSAGYANYVNGYECATIGSAAIKVGNAGLPSGHFAYLADDGLVYDISNITKNISPVFKKVGVLNNAVNKNTAITSTYFRTVMQLSTAAIGNIPHATLSLGNRVFLRCTMDANGYIHSDNYLATSMSAGYTWLPFGVATASNAVNMDTRNQNFYTLNANGKLTHIDGIEIATGS